MRVAGKKRAISCALQEKNARLIAPLRGWFYGFIHTKIW
ncbi:hypothetical protein L579_4381 [Pantoea sp. AS-PWVM4]|nr:hypothetical protein L579_4381 [Pantoea sp. AS-PWVM4]